jgi:predicted RNA-binding Zn ribbon-like protein
VNFDSHVETVVTVAAALVNAMTAGEARGRGYEPPPAGDRAAAVTAALREASPATPELTEAQADQLTAIAGWLRVVFDAASRADLDAAAMTVNALLAETGARPQLDRHDGEPWHLHFHGSTESLAQGWAAGCATGLAVLLGTERSDRLGVCTAPRCDRVYVDLSRNSTRRFCSASCQNRVKAAAFRARQE